MWIAARILGISLDLWWDFWIVERRVRHLKVPPGGEEARRWGRRMSRRKARSSRAGWRVVVVVVVSRRRAFRMVENVDSSFSRWVLSRLSR